MLDGTVLEETPSIMDETASTYSICKGRHFEEINKGTAWALGSQKCTKPIECFCSIRILLKWLLAACSGQPTHRKGKTISKSNKRLREYKQEQSA